MLVQLFASGSNHALTTCFTVGRVGLEPTTQGL
ncbi:Protein of unknown function [Propionibacterium freudenreichii]|nr:Protein of unknown function [Propionibacterium freudenreichii]